MSAKQSPLKPAYSGSGAPASAVCSPATSMVASGQTAGAPSASFSPSTAPVSSNSLHNSVPNSVAASSAPHPSSSLYQGLVGGTANSVYAPGNGAPPSIYPADTISPDSSAPLHPPPSYSNTTSSPSPQIKPSPYQQHEYSSPGHNHQPQPQQSTFPPPKDDRHNYTQPPQKTYQQQHTTPEKLNPEVMSNEIHPYANGPALSSRNTWTFGVFDCFSPLSTCKKSS